MTDYDAQISVREAMPEDLESMVRLLGVLFELERDFDPDPETQRRGLALLMDSDTAAAFVALIEDQVVGMVTVQTLISTAEGGAVGLVEDLVVDKAWQGSGIGSRLLGAVDAWARDRGQTRLQLLSDTQNATAIAFYSMQGWGRTQLMALRRKFDD